MQPSSALIQGSIPKALIAFSLPVMAGNVLQTVNGSVNAVWVGSFLGEAALTATSNSNMLIFLLTSAVFGVSMAANVLVAQRVGARNILEARRTAGASATFFAVVSLATSVLGVGFAHVLLRWMHTPADAMPLALAYLRIIFVALPFSFGFFFVMAVLRGAGDSKTPFLFLALSVVLDIALNPLLIFGWGPIPRMGIAGSATATLIAQAVSLSALIITLYRRKHFLTIRRGELQLFAIDWNIIRILVVKGVPIALQMIVMSSSMLVTLAFVNRYGTEVTAAFAAAIQLWGYIQMPSLALSASVSSMAAQNVGAGRWDRVSQVTKVGVLFNCCLGGALIGLVYSLNTHVLGWFLPAGSSALVLAAHINATVIWSFIFFGISMVLVGVVRATGATFAPLVLLFIAFWLVRVPFAYFLQPFFGADAVWWSFPASAIAAATLSFLYYRYGGWRRMRLTVPSATAGAVQAGAAMAEPKFTAPAAAAGASGD